MSKNPKARQFTWISGKEDILQTEVLTFLLQELQPSDLNFHTYDALRDPQNKILEGLSLFPIGAGKSVHVVRNAQALEDTSFIEVMIKAGAKNSRRCVIFQSTEEKVPTDYDKEARKRVRKPHIKAFSGKGTIVECKPFADMYSNHAVQWVQHKTACTTRQARQILEVTNGNLRLVRDVCAKVNALGVYLTINLLNSMVALEPRETFVDALVMQDRADALKSIPDIPVADYGMIIGQLDSILELMGKLHHLRLEGRPMSDLIKSAGARSFMVPRLIEHTAYYNPAQVARIRSVLLACDTHLHEGAHEGMLEVIVGSW